MTDRQASFQIGDWLVEPTLNRISSAGRETKIEPKVMDVLVFLAGRPGDVASREELLDEVWAGTVVTDDVVTRSISELRRVLGDDRRSPRYIETIPKSGYRLVATVREGGQPTSTAEPDQALPSWWRGGAVVVAISLAILFTQRSALYPDPKAFQSRIVTSYPGSERSPSLSPDGRQVAFTWTGEAGDNHDVYLRFVDDGPALRITEHPGNDFRPTWSPDGTQIAFVRWDTTCSLQMVSALGGQSREMSPCGNTIYPDPSWSPDGSSIAMNGREGDDGPFAIYLISPHTLERRQITSPPNGIWGDHDPSYSPNGDFLAFTRSASEGMQDLYLVDLQSGSEKALTAESRNIWGHTWIDNSTIVFSSNRTGRPSLWRLDIDEPRPEWLGVAADEAKFPTASRDRMVFVQTDADVNIWRIPIDAVDQAVPIAVSTRWDMHPRFSPDGSRMAFVSNRSGGYEVWTAGADGGNASRLTQFGVFSSSPRWSPDGRNLVFTSRPDGHADLYSIAADGHQPHRLTEDPTDELAPFWTNNGSAILFSSNRTGRWEVYRMELEGDGEATRLTSDGGLGAQEDADGVLYYAKPGQPGIWRMHRPEPTSAESEELVIPALDTRDWGSWVVQDGALTYLRRGRPSLVLRRDLATGSEDTVYVAQKPVPAMDPALHVSPDGKMLLLGMRDRSESDLLAVTR